MESGFYATRIANHPESAPGVTIIEETRIRGGDSHFLYSGTIMVNGAGEVLANIKLCPYNQLPDEAFGTTDNVSFELSLTGEKTTNGFHMTGYAPNGNEIVIEAGKLANIDLTA